MLNLIVKLKTKTIRNSYSLKTSLRFRYMHFLCFVQYFVPLILISFAYIRIAVVLWGSKIPGAAQDQRDQIVLKNKKKVSFRCLVDYQL